MQSCTRIFTFDSAHRVLEHKSLCKHLHGHTYKLELTCVSPELDKLGMVADFSDIKTLTNAWLLKHLDHNLILSPDDPFKALFRTREVIEMNGGREPFFMSQNQNPTAENIAALLCEELDWIMTSELKVSVYKTKLWETPNCSSTYVNKKFQ